jgi:sulfur-oxidizing protein SoxX
MRTAIITAFVAVGMAATALPAVAQSAHTWGPGADDAAFAAMLKGGFREQGTVKLDRLVQDETQAFCSDPAVAMSAAGAATAARLEAANLATVKFPSDGRWLGDWKKGEALAQSGRGLTWTDGATQANGGNCYNCHQIGPDEISFGTIGPPLLGYGKDRGRTEETLRYTWAKIWNSKSSNACSNMPRAGAMGILGEEQIRDIMALLFDPASPVNR